MDSSVLFPLEQEFLRQSGEFLGVCKHIGPDDQQTLKIDIISEEAVETSEIKARSSTATACNPRCASSSASALKLRA